MSPERSVTYVSERTLYDNIAMRLRFNEAKATQVAARMLRLRGGSMSYMKLIKLMYLVDREGLRRWGRAVSTDRYVSMDRGPVLSRVYSLITEEPEPDSFWAKHITPRRYDVELTVDPGDDELSPAEEALIDEIFAEHGRKNRWQLVDELHKVPEWQDPAGSSIPIDLSDLLKAIGKTDSEIAAIESELENLSVAELLLQPR